MSTIVQPSDFKGKYTLANTSETYVIQLIQDCIDEKEPELLTLLLGAELYSDLKAGTGDIWVSLKDQVKKSIICYVYWWYRRDNVTQNTGTGEVISSNANSTVISPIQKMVDRWNEMVDNNRVVVKFIQDNPIDYGVYYQVNWPYGCYSQAVRNIFVKQNTFNI